MSLQEHDVATRARVVRARLARLRAHQTETRQRLQAVALQELLDAGYSLGQAGKILGLSRSFVHRAANCTTEPTADGAEFNAIDAAVESYVLD